MRKVLTALAGGALAMTLAAPAAHAAPPARTAPQVRAQSHHAQGDDDWGGGDDDDHYYHHHEDHCHGLVTRLLCWLV